MHILPHDQVIIKYLIMLGGASVILGGIQLAKGLIDNANRQTPEQYEETTEMKQARLRAAEMAKSGYTPAEKAAFRQSLAQTGNAAFRKSVDLGGGSLASAVRAGINAQQLGAQNQFASNDAALMRNNIAQSNQLEQGYQRLQNAQVDQQRQVAMQQAQAASQSINSGLGNIGSALNLTQALNWKPNNGNVDTTGQQVSGGGYEGVITPSGQQSNGYGPGYTIGPPQAGSLQNTTLPPALQQQNPFLNNLYGNQQGLYGNYPSLYNYNPYSIGNY